MALIVVKDKNEKNKGHYLYKITKNNQDYIEDNIKYETPEGTVIDNFKFDNTKYYVLRGSDSNQILPLIQLNANISEYEPLMFTYASTGVDAVKQLYGMYGIAVSEIDAVSMTIDSFNSGRVDTVASYSSYGGSSSMLAPNCKYIISDKVLSNVLSCSWKGLPKQLDQYYYVDFSHLTMGEYIPVQNGIKDFIKPMSQEAIKEIYNVLSSYGKIYYLQGKYYNTIRYGFEVNTKIYAPSKMFYAKKDPSAVDLIENVTFSLHMPFYVAYNSPSDVTEARVSSDFGESVVQNVGVPSSTGINGATYFSTTCFTPDTKITMADGSFKEIKDIQKGDKVLCSNDKADKVIFIDSYRNKHQDGYTIYTFEDKILKIVNDHRVYSVEDNCYKKLSQFKIGEHTLDINNNKIKLLKKKVIKNDTQHCTIFTKYHNNYYANGILCGNNFANRKNKFKRKFLILCFRILVLFRIMR